MSHFKKDQVVPIYQRPISQEKHEGKAKLVECLREAGEFNYPGMIVEEWLVRFLGEGGCYEHSTYPRIVIQREGAAP